MSTVEAMTDPMNLLSRALDQLSDVLGGIRPEQVDNPTPCPEWTVATLASHVVFDTSQFTKSARGERADWSAPPPELTDEWRPAFDRGARGLLSAWQTVGDLSDSVRMPMGDVPYSFLVEQEIAEFAVHAWDLARATGHKGQFDDGVAAAGLAFAERSLKPEFRGPGKSFGAEIPVPQDAPPTERLVGFFGRDPGWSPRR